MGVTECRPISVEVDDFSVILVVDTKNPLSRSESTDGYTVTVFQGYITCDRSSFIGEFTLFQLHPDDPLDDDWVKYNFLDYCNMAVLGLKYTPEDFKEFHSKVRMFNREEDAKDHLQFAEESLHGLRNVGLVDEEINKLANYLDGIYRNFYDPWNSANMQRQPPLSL